MVAGLHIFAAYMKLRGCAPRGSLNKVRRKCGKLGCACAAPDHPSHGLQLKLTRTVGGRARAVHLRPGPELDKVRREVAEYQRFRDLAGQVTDVNEEIRAARLAVPGDQRHELRPRLNQHCPVMIQPAM